MRKHITIWIAIFILFILAGTIIFHNIEGWDYFNSTYFTVITMTTVGYGDLFPTSVISKMFVMLFAFFGVGMYFYFISIMINHFSHKHIKKHVDELRRELRKDKRR